MAKTMEFHFDDVPLTVGVAGQTARISLISGKCEIEYEGNLRDSLTWGIISVTLTGPIKGDPDVPVKFVREGQTGRELWDWVAGSVMLDRATEIQEAISEDLAESGQVDPDMKRELERDTAREG